MIIFFQVSHVFFLGNRGLTMHTWASNATDTALDDIPAKSTSDPTYIEEYLEDGDFVVPVATVGYIEGYLSPTINASYQLKLTGDANSLCSVKFSNTLDPADAVSNQLNSGIEAIIDAVITSSGCSVIRSSSRSSNSNYYYYYYYNKHH